jgi:hypothetical protein
MARGRSCRIRGKMPKKYHSNCPGFENRIPIFTRNIMLREHRDVLVGAERFGSTTSASELLPGLPLTDRLQKTGLQKGRCSDLWFAAASPTMRWHQTKFSGAVFPRSLGEYPIIRGWGYAIYLWDRKSPTLRAFRYTFLRALDSLSSGWEIRTREAILNQAHSPVRERPQKRFPSKFISSSNRFNFESRTGAVESKASERNGPFRE